MDSIARRGRSARLVGWMAVVAAVCMVGLVALAYCFGRPFVCLLTTEEVAGQYGILWVLVLNAGLFNVAQILFLNGQNHRRLAGYIPAWGLKTVIFLAAAYWLTGRHGLQGMAWSSCLSSLIFLLAVGAANRRFVAESVSAPARGKE